MRYNTYCRTRENIYHNIFSSNAEIIILKKSGGSLVAAFYVFQRSNFHTTVLAVLISLMKTMVRMFVSVLFTWHRQPKHRLIKMMTYNKIRRMLTIDKVDIQHDDITVCSVFQNVSNKYRLNVIMSLLLLFSCYQSMWE